MDLSYSFAHMILNPAFSKPLSSPPHPEKRETILRAAFATIRSMLKVNEFTLAGAVLADSLGRGADKKRKGGEPTHSSPKSVTISERIQYTRKNLSGYNTLRVHYARAIHGRWRVFVLFLVFVKVSSFQVKNKSDTQREFTLVLADFSKRFLDTKKGVELNALTT
jgi:hypothetical protein